MNTLHRQTGASALNLLAVLLIAVFIATCAMKIIPLYIDNSSYQNSVESVVEDAKAGMSRKLDIQAKLDKLFVVNRIDFRSARDIKFSKKNGKTVIDATYERRVPLMFNIDVVVKFDKLIYEYSSGSR